MSDLVCEPLKDQSLYEVLDEEFGIDTRELHDKARRLAERAKYCGRKYSRELMEDGLMIMKTVLLYLLVPTHTDPVPPGLEGRVDQWYAMNICRELLDGVCGDTFDKSSNAVVRVPAQLVVDAIDFRLARLRGERRRKEMFSIDWAQTEPKRIRIIGEPSLGLRKHWKSDSCVHVDKVEETNQDVRRVSIAELARGTMTFVSEQTRKDLGCSTCIHLTAVKLTAQWCRKPGGIVDYSNGNKWCRKHQQSKATAAVLPEVGQTWKHKDIDATVEVTEVTEKIVTFDGVLGPNWVTTSAFLRTYELTLNHENCYNCAFFEAPSKTHGKICIGAGVPLKITTPQEGCSKWLSKLPPEKVRVV